MKLFVLFTLFACSCGVELMDPYVKIREKCQKQLRLSPRELEALNDNLQESGPYLLCFARTLGVINDQGDFDVDLIVEKMQPVTPLIVLKPLISCCFKRALTAFSGEESSEEATFERIGVFANCYKARIPSEMWNVMGVLGEPVYPQLDDCCN